MSQFTFTYAKIIRKTRAFESYLEKNFAAAALLVFVDVEFVQITSNAELISTEIAELDALVAAYTDPDVFLVYSSTESLVGISKSTDSPTLTDVQSFIHTSLTHPNGDAVRPDNSIVDQIKFILRLSVAEVAECAALTSGSAQIQLYNASRNLIVGTQTVDLTEQVLQFQAAALANQTGPQTVYKVVQMYNLRHHSVDSDCVWVLRLASPDSRIKISTNGFQKLFFTAQ